MNTASAVIVVAALLSTLGNVRAAAAQRPRTEAAAIVPASAADDELRRLELLGDTSRGSSLLRSVSTTQTGRAVDRHRRRGMRPIWPDAHLVYNSGFAAGENDGLLWAGRGASALVRAGATLDVGPVRLVALPEVALAQNRAFPVIAGRDAARSAYASPWHVGRYSADLPLRFGDAPLRTVGAGQSSVTLRLGPATIGAATENAWWGPGVRNALVLSANAAGFPHAFVGTAHPVRTPAGLVEARWMVGALTESPYFDTRGEDDHRAFAGAIATLRPRFDSRLTVGVERGVVTPSRGGGAFLSHALDTFTRWAHAPDDSTAAARPNVSVAGAFARWLFPDAGFEVYGEWTRTDPPRSLRELLIAPHNTQAYTLGVGHTARIRPDRALIMRLELTDLEQSRILADRPAPVDYYAAPDPPQGYTERGQVLGAQIGPGASSEWASLEYAAHAWRGGVFAERVRRENDALYREPLVGPRHHDVELRAGVRGTVLLPRALVTAELSFADRLNYLFQNGSANIGGVRTVDLHNLQLVLDVVPGRRAP